MLNCSFKSARGCFSFQKYIFRPPPLPQQCDGWTLASDQKKKRSHKLKPSEWNNSLTQKQSFTKWIRCCGVQTKVRKFNSKVATIINHDNPSQPAFRRLYSSVKLHRIFSFLVHSGTARHPRLIRWTKTTKHSFSFSNILFAITFLLTCWLSSGFESRSSIIFFFGRWPSHLGC